MLKQSVSTEKAEVDQVEAQMKNGQVSLSLDLDLSLPRSLVASLAAWCGRIQRNVHPHRSCANA